MEEIIKVNPKDLPYLHQFFNINLQWDVDFYDECLEYTRGYLVHHVGVFLIYLTPSFLLVPQYRYSDTFLKDRFGFDVKYDSIIKLENLSTFTIQKVPDNLDYKIDMLLDTGYDYNCNDWWVRLWKLEVVVKSKIKDGRSPFYNWLFLNQDIERIDFEKVLKTVNWAQGKSYFKFSSRKNSLVVDRIHFVENTIYANMFSKEDPEHILFDPFSKTLQSYGDTFEDVLSTIKELTILIGPNHGIGAG
jgi:hypothetical protein